LKSSWERNRWVILASFALEGIAFRIVLPFVPLYIQELGVSDPSQVALWSGVSLGLMAFAVAVMLPLWDRMAQRTGRKFQVLRALAGCILGLTAMAAAQSALQLFLSFVFEGLISGFTPQMWTLVSTGAPAGGVGEAMGLLQFIDLLISAIAPFLGGVLVDHVGFRIPYLLAALLCAAALGTMWLGYRDESPDQEGESTGRPSRLLGGSPGLSDGPPGIPITKVLEVPGLFPILALAFLFVCFVPGVNPLIPLYLQGLASPGTPVATLAGLALAAGSVAGALAALSSGWMTRRWSARNLMVISFVAGGAATALVPVIPSVEAAFAMWVVRSALTGGIIALLYAVADAQLPPQVAKGAYAHLTGALVFGYAAGPIATGAMGAVDLRGAFVTVGALLALMGLWAARAFGPHKTAPQ